MHAATPAAPAPRRPVTHAINPGGPPAKKAGRQVSKIGKIVVPPHLSTHQKPKPAPAGLGVVDVVEAAEGSSMSVIEDAEMIAFLALR